MSQRGLPVLAFLLPGLLLGCANADQGKVATRAIAPATAVTASVAGAATPAAATADPATGNDDVVDLATDESCRKLALHTIRQQDGKADRVFLSDSTPAGRYRREGNLISGDHGQYRTDAGWTALTGFRCTVDADGHAVSFEYRPGKAQTWAEMSDQH